MQSEGQATRNAPERRGLQQGGPGDVEPAGQDLHRERPALHQKPRQVLQAGPQAHPG